MIEKELAQEISNNIRAERNRCKLSQIDVSCLLKINRETYINYETDASNIKVSTLIKLAKIFKCNVSDFYLHK